jgi:hypothetical protein
MFMRELKKLLGQFPHFHNNSTPWVAKSFAAANSEDDVEKELTKLPASFL